jgi:hypothetical protein
MRRRRRRVKMKQQQQQKLRKIRKPTIGSAMARARSKPCRPDGPELALEGGEGPAIALSLKMEAASGKKGLPGTGGWRQAIWRA